MIGFNLILLPSDLKQDWKNRVARQGNTQRRDAIAVTYPEVRRCARLYLSGYSVTTIAKLRNVPESRVYKVLKYTGMPKWVKSMNTFNRRRRRESMRPVSVNTYLTQTNLS